MALSTHFSRRRFLQVGGIAAAGAGLAACTSGGAVDEEVENPTPEVALRLLEEGNKRYREGKSEEVNESIKRRELVAKGQKPWAVIFSCIDSRVPPELVFDRGLGDFFVVRTGGHVLDPITLGSIEYGVEHGHAPLVFVLGHAKCGAVDAAVQGGEAPGSIAALVAGIKPAVQRSAGKAGDKVDNAVRENIVLTVANLKASPVLSKAIAAKKAQIVGGRYDIDSGAVEITVR